MRNCLYRRFCINFWNSVHHETNQIGSALKVNEFYLCFTLCITSFALIKIPVICCFLFLPQQHSLEVKIPTCLMSLMFSLLSFSYILNGVFQSYNNKYTNQILRRINKAIFLTNKKWKKYNINLSNL